MITLKFTKNKAKRSQYDACRGSHLKKDYFLRIRFALSVAMSVTKAPTVSTNRKERSKNLKQINISSSKSEIKNGEKKEISEYKNKRTYSEVIVRYWK